MTRGIYRVVLVLLAHFFEMIVRLLEAFVVFLHSESYRCIGHQVLQARFLIPQSRPPVGYDGPLIAGMNKHLVLVTAQCGVELVARVPVEEFLVHVVSV